MDEVYCKQCGCALDGSDPREPCPSCSGTARLFKVSLEGAVDIAGSFGTRFVSGRRVRSGGRNRPAQERIDGEFLGRKPVRLVIKEQLIDREHDTYREYVVDARTGEVLRDIQEPLSRHRQRGSDREK